MNNVARYSSFIDLKICARYKNIHTQYIIFTLICLVDILCKELKYHYNFIQIYNMYNTIPQILFIILAI